MCITYFSNNYKSQYKYNIENKKKDKDKDSTQAIDTVLASTNLKLSKSKNMTFITRDLSTLTSFLERKLKEYVQK